MKKTIGNRYYHASSQCLLAKHPHFTMDKLVIPPELHVNDEHVRYMTENGLNVSRVLKKICY